MKTIDDWVEEEERRADKMLSNDEITPKEHRKMYKRIYREARSYEAEEGKK